MIVIVVVVVILCPLDLNPFRLPLTFSMYPWVSNFSLLLHPQHFSVLRRTLFSE